ncbi:MAG TPA: glycosyltransferase family 4 protein [Isosphaeraceae bacterium]|jgi:glycosyltransferase involved in cell wall biosynthesis|nr:glycosyltransferase family 4 protein [Isosphaeraceae bacterium]
MADAPRNIVLLAGRLPDWPDAWRIGPLVGRLHALGFVVQVVCLANGGVMEASAGLIECPGLGSRWLRRWATRGLHLGEGPLRPALLHVLHSEMSHAGLRLAIRWRIPYVQTVDEFIPLGGRLRISRRWCRALIAPGRDLADDLLQSLRVPESLVAIVSPGVPIPHREPDVQVRPRVPVVGAAGPLVIGSGLVTFLNAARNVVAAGLDTEFVIAGHGPVETDLRRLAERLRIADRVTFTADPGSSGTFWKVLDAFCQTSLVPTVGRPLATALAHGIPAIAADVPGLRSWMADESVGLRVPPGDTDALYRAIITLLTDPAQARIIGLRGRAWVADAFHPDREAQALAALYQRVASLADHPSVSSTEVQTLQASSS